MQIRTARAIYSRPPAYSHGSMGKRHINTISMLTNELRQLENEKKIVETKISSVERRIRDIQTEINALNYALKETKEFLEYNTTPLKLKHITMEY